MYICIDVYIAIQRYIYIYMAVGAAAREKGKLENCFQLLMWQAGVVSDSRLQRTAIFTGSSGSDNQGGHLSRAVADSI